MELNKKQISITLGSFDCYDERSETIVKHLTKASVPLMMRYVFLFDDFVHYKLNKKFPIHNVVCVMFDDNKEFIGRKVIKKLGVPIKFIKSKS